MKQTKFVIVLGFMILTLIGCINISQEQKVDIGKTNMTLVESNEIPRKTVIIEEPQPEVTREEVDKEPEAVESSILIDVYDINNPLKELQLRYVSGQISREEYFNLKNDIGDSDYGGYSISKERLSDFLKIKGDSIVIDINLILGDDLKELQIKYITGKISKETYSKEELRILSEK